MKEGGEIHKSKEGGCCKGEKRTESPKSDPLVQASPQCRKGPQAGQVGY